MRSIFVALLMLNLAIYNILSQTTDLDSLKIDLTAETPHQFVFSNKKASFWYGETQQANQNSYEGYTILEQRYLQDYSLFVDGKPVDRSTAEEIELYPDRLVRSFPKFKETFYFVDSLNLLLLEVVPSGAVDLGVYFHFTEPVMKPQWNWNSEKNSVETIFTGFGLDKPTHIACRVQGDARKITADIQKEEEFGKFSGGIGFKMSATGKVIFAVMFANSRPGLERLYESLDNLDAIKSKRRERITQLLKKNRLKTGSPQLDLAYRWALISLNDLVTRQRGEGIWAGLPWFNNYWGRDSFISFTGALLCTGQFETARQVLLSFAEFQNRDDASPNFGRVPNRVMIRDIIYNTADGTPWFVKACENYVRYSGDRQFIEQIFPTIERSVRGALKNYVDEFGFLTHGDAETWMDAVGADGPWSPRGNRAVEIQALWIEQLRIASEWAEYLGFEEQSVKWKRTREKAVENFRKMFWNETNRSLYDHLNSDGTPDTKLRPNQVFALTVPRNPLLDKDRATAVLSRVVEYLVYPWGVGSLWQNDPDFHPYHHYMPYYVPDAAYHNGVVWTWLAGPVLSALFPANNSLAFSLLQNEANQILTKDAIGSYSELLEAWPRPGANYPKISGTVSQAWNLAEFIRNIQQDLLGCRPDSPADTITIAPQLPTALHQVEFSFSYCSDLINAVYSVENGAFRVKLDSNDKTGDRTHLSFCLPASQDEMVRFAAAWDMKSPLNAVVRSGSDIQVNGKVVKDVIRENCRPLDDLKFCEPAMDMNLAVLKGLDFDLIPPDEVVRRPSRLTPILMRQDDPEKDDVGPNGHYVYPSNPAFEPGIFDGRSVRIWKDDSNYYFKIEYANLVNPGWRPESGYQLTYTAIALNFGDKAGLRRTRVEMNANYTIPFEYAYNYIIFVGNGLRIMNSKGDIVAEYRPVDSTHPIGFVKDKTVQFSLPRKYFPSTRLENAFVMIGGQDDHGAGGVGEFRTVGQKAGEWEGGGGENPTGNPSVYDVIEVR